MITTGNKVRGIYVLKRRKEGGFRRKTSGKFSGSSFIVSRKEAALEAH